MPEEIREMCQGDTTWVTNPVTVVDMSAESTTNEARLTDAAVAKALTRAANARKERKRRKSGGWYEAPWTRTAKPNHDFTTIEWLTWYDWIFVNSSAGKDSQAMLDYLYHLAAELGILDRLVVVHCDLGRVEWEGTCELAERQAKAYGLRFEVVRNENWADLLERIEARGQFPGRATRYCTSEFKTGQAQRLATRLVGEYKAVRNIRGKGPRPVRILNCLGLRAQESIERAGKEPFRRFMAEQEGDNSGWTNGLRTVDEWLPIHTWSVEDVWATIKRSGVEHHPIYDEGMPRLSCSLCPLASFEANVKASIKRPDLADEYEALEGRLNARFLANGQKPRGNYSDKFTMAQVNTERRRRIAAGDVNVQVADWQA